MSYRDNIDALAARHAALEAEVAAKLRERDGSAQLLREAKAKARLPVLAELRVATPCEADWNQMVGDHRVRRCGDCKQNVYNFSAMTRAEAEAVIVAKDGKMCMRYYERSDGTMLLKDCSIKRERRGALFAAGAAAAAVAGAGLWFAQPSEPPAKRVADDSHLALPPGLRDAPTIPMLLDRPKPKTLPRIHEDLQITAGIPTRDWRPVNVVDPFAPTVHHKKR